MNETVRIARSQVAAHEAKARLEAAGVEVLGPTDHTIFQSIYFFDPNGHRIELAVNTAKPGMHQEL